MDCVDKNTFFFFVDNVFLSYIKKEDKTKQKN